LEVTTTSALLTLLTQFVAVIVAEPKSIVRRWCYISFPLAVTFAILGAIAGCLGMVVWLPDDRIAPSFGVIVFGYKRFTFGGMLGAVITTLRPTHSRSRR